MGSLQTEIEDEFRMFNFENFVLIAYINKVIPYRNEMAVCGKNYIKHTNIKFVQNIKVLSVRIIKRCNKHHS